jgi:hypothetical protein
MPLRPVTIATNSGAASQSLPDPPASRGDSTPANVSEYVPPAPTIPSVVTPQESLQRNRARGWEPPKSGPAGE